MKIVFDCRYMRFARHDGISRYGARLVEALAQAASRCTMLISDERQLAMLPDLPWITAAPAPRARASRGSPAWSTASSPTSSSPPCRPWAAAAGSTRSCTTVHDLIYYTQPHAAARPARPVRLLWRAVPPGVVAQRLLLNRADAHRRRLARRRATSWRHRLTRHPITVVLLGTEQPACVARARTTPRDTDARLHGLVHALQERRHCSRARMHQLPGLPAAAAEPHLGPPTARASRRWRPPGAS